MFRPEIELRFPPPNLHPNHYAELSTAEHEISITFPTYFQISFSELLHILQYF